MSITETQSSIHIALADERVHHEMLGGTGGWSMTLLISGLTGAVNYVGSGGMELS